MCNDAAPVTTTSSTCATSETSDQSKLGIVEKVLDVVIGRKLLTNPTDCVRFVCGWIGTIFALITLVVLLANAPPVPSANNHLKLVALPFLVIWTVVPPIYFWFDYFVLWHIESRNKTTTFSTLEEFKHGQELSRNLWLAIVVLLAGLYYKP